MKDRIASFGSVAWSYHHLVVCLPSTPSTMLVTYCISFQEIKHIRMAPVFSCIAISAATLLELLFN